MFTENGWPSCGYDDCDTGDVPGTSISVPVQKGVPNTILKAFLADLNQYVEPYNGENDWGGWTATNSVATSNHLGGTAVDFNWDDHPMGPDAEDPAAGWQGSTLIDGDEVPAVRDLLNWYEGMVYWGADWTTPKDSMHFQMGYDTYDEDNNRPEPPCQDFINRKIRPDGFSTYQRGGMPIGGVAGSAPPVDPTQVIPAPGPSAADVLVSATGVDADTAGSVLGAVSAGLAASQCNTVNRIAMWLAQIGWESAHFTATVEIGDIDGTTYQGRTWIQITGEDNYASFSQWAYNQGLVNSPTYFVDNPAALGDIEWAGVGPAWYWTVERPQINGLCDQGDVEAVTEAINGGDNGLDGRTQLWNQALAQGDSLLTLLPGSTGGTITVADIAQADWDNLVADVKEIRAQLGGDSGWPQLGSDANAIATLEALAASGAPMSLVDAIAWLKHHASTHKAPTP